MQTVSQVLVVMCDVANKLCARIRLTKRTHKLQLCPHLRLAIL